MKRFSSICLFFGFFCLLNAQNEGEKVDSVGKSVTITALPVVYLTPETGLALGAGASLAYRLPGAVHASTIRGGAVYTLRKQFLSFIGYQLYLKKDKYRLNGEIGYFNYLFEYYGIGNAPKQRELYDDNYFSFQLTATKKLRKGLYTGISSQLEWHNLSNFDDIGNLVADQPRGMAGGNLGLIGPIIQWDTRDNVYYASKGHYLESTVRWSDEALGADYNFINWRLDFRKYIAIKKQVLAFQFFQETNTGEVPFYRLSLLGGSKKLRGYYEGYLRDQVYWSSQVEWRGDLFWRLGFAAFAGVGTTSPDWASIFDRTYWPSYGLGLRFSIVPKEKINLRLDYAFGRGTSALYITFAEAF